MSDDASKKPDATIALGWWSVLQPEHDSGGDRAALARLRRCATATQAASEPATIELAHRLGIGWEGLGRVAVLAAVLAHIRKHDGSAKAARQLRAPDRSTPLMSLLRFRRLIQAETEDDRIIAFRRAAALARGSLNVWDLADSLLHWNDKTRQRWLYDYHLTDLSPTDPKDITP
jgi:CRISPR system Cascade subunit CasB